MCVVKASMEASQGLDDKVAVTWAWLPPVIEELKDDWVQCLPAACHLSGGNRSALKAWS